MIEPRRQQQALVPEGGIELFDRDMTATVAADIPLEVLQRRLAEVNQWLPIDGDPARPVGELVEINSTGPLRLGYGGWRDLLLGVQFTNGRGELITAGGRAVKNVAGYDLAKLMVGQGGMLGRIVTITTRTYRQPEGAILAAFRGDVRHLNQLLPTPLRPQWSVLTADELLCGYLGDARTIEYCAAALARLASPKPVRVETRPLADDVAHRAAVFSMRADAPDAFRASVPPMRISDFVSHGRPERWAADAAHGIVVGTMSDMGRANEAAAAIGGRIIYGGGGIEPVADSPGVGTLVERLKAAFDPTNHGGHSPNRTTIVP
jgi:hypothetical protein